MTDAPYRGPDRRRSECTWRRTAEHGNHWRTACGKYSYERDPAHAGFEFCPYCSRRLEQLA